MSRKGWEETVTEKRTRVEITCDFCGIDLREGQKGFRHDVVRLDCRAGDIFPEGDFRERLNYDCCTACFKTKIIPAIEAATGVKPMQLDPETGEVY